MNKLGWICCYFTCCKESMKTHHRLIKLYETGSDKFESELGIEKILYSLRALKIYHKAQVGDKAKFLIQYNRKNVIDVEKS